MMNQATPEGANDSFYHAFEELSIQNMDKIWSHNEGSSCVHPGWELVVGWIAIRRSWIQIFADTESIKIRVNTSGLENMVKWRLLYVSRTYRL